MRILILIGLCLLLLSTASAASSRWFQGVINTTNPNNCTQLTFNNSSSQPGAPQPLNNMNTRQSNPANQRIMLNFNNSTTDQRQNSMVAPAVYSVPTPEPSALLSLCAGIVCLGLYKKLR